MPQPPNDRFATVLWLLPAEPARSALRKIIARLAPECGAPIFEPHLTLGFGAAKMVGHAAAGPIELRALDLGCSAQFTKTLFLRLENSRPLVELRESLGMNTGDFDPHLSLLYCDPPETRKAQLVRSIVLPFASILFDSLALIRCPDPTESRADVEAWEVVVSRKLIHQARAIRRPRLR